MNRRRFLRRLAAIPALPVFSPLLERFAPSAAFRRVRPKDPGWPSPAAWDELKARVGGRLVPVTSPFAPCVAAPSSAACESRLKDLANPYFIGEQAGGTQCSGWADAWSTSPSVYAVAAQNAADVSAAVNFARDHRLRLVVKGGGHSYQGTSNAPDSLLVWTRAMSAITLEDAFVPRGCAAPARRAVTVEAGARWLQAYDAVTVKAGRYVQGGGCCTVGVAGLIQSGGFGSFSKNFGMAAASLLEAEVVTADGKVRIANACTEPDLFWGLKGGGGGSLGVVTKVTLATHDLPENFGWAEGKIRAKSDAAFRRLIAEFLRFYEKALFNPHWGEQVSFEDDNSMELSLVSSGLTAAQAREVWQPFIEAVGKSADYEVTERISVGAMASRNWWDAEWRMTHASDSMVADPRPGAPRGNVWWSGNSIEANLFLSGYESLWMPASLLRDPERLAGAIFTASRSRNFGFHFNKGLAGAPAARIAEARDTATNPAVLDAFALAIVANGMPHSAIGLPGHEPDLAACRKEAAGVAAAASALRALVPEAGAYVSESNYFDKTFQKSYWGANYPRLAQVKKKYDPDGLFFVHNGVGSEGWSQDGFTRL